jgi:hypothetical protein
MNSLKAGCIAKPWSVPYGKPPQVAHDFICVITVEVRSLHLTDDAAERGR